MTTENNKIIAEFMGLSYCEKHLYTGWYKNHEHNERICDFNGLKYHSDWNWLMQVVEKIESIEDQRFLFQISSRQGFYAEVRMRFYYNEKIEDAFGKTRIEAVYNACLTFIEWYNENAA